MAQIRNKTDIAESIKEEEKTSASLPNFFNSIDEIPPFKGISLSVGAHALFIILFIAFGTIYEMLYPHLPKPKMPVQDVEFRLVQNESQKPINPKTKIRSDRDSRAGGKHNPKLKVSDPTPNPAPKKAAQKPVAAKKAQQNTKPAAAKKPLLKPQPKTIAKQPKTTTQPQVKTKPLKQPVVALQPTQTRKPTPVKAPSAAKPKSAPVLKPNVAPVAPKLAAAPKSPFKVTVPPSAAPVGSTYRPQSTSGAKTGSSSSTGGGSISPKFSSKTGSSGGSGASGSSKTSSGSGGSYAYRGTPGGSGGSGGNPGPGNPNGTPGIDAIKQPNWGPYMRDLEQKIKRNWTPPKGDSSKRIIITFTIGRDGRLLSHRISKSSGVPLADRAAMSAIELTAPFRPLPPEFKGQSVAIEFTFDYNVLNSVIR